MNEKSIVILLGGISSEKEISLITGKAVFNALKKKRDISLVELDRDFEKILPRLKQADLIFNALHGGTGENGVIPAALDLHNIKYTGSEPGPSKKAMDKHVSKLIALENDILTPDWVWYRKGIHDYNELMQDILSLGFPQVVKPADEGSTVGLTIVKSENKLEPAVNSALDISGQIIFEKYIPGRELTVSILNEKSLPVVEIKPSHDLYDYECKYTKGMSEYHCPAELSNEVEKSIRDTALYFHDLLGCRHYSRVDFRLNPENEFYLLELNTLPGMTPTSLLPMAAQAEGIDFIQLLETIINCAFKS